MGNGDDERETGQLGKKKEKKEKVEPTVILENNFHPFFLRTSKFMVWQLALYSMMIKPCVKGGMEAYPLFLMDHQR